MCQCVVRCPRKDRKRQLVSVDEAVLVKSLLVKLGLSAHFAASYHTPTPSAVLLFFIYIQPNSCVVLAPVVSSCPFVAVVHRCVLCQRLCVGTGKSSKHSPDPPIGGDVSANQLRLRLGIQMKICCIAPASAHTNQQRARMASVGFSMRRMANFAALALFLLHMTLVASQNPFRISSLSPNSIASSGGMFISVHAANGGLLPR